MNLVSQFKQPNLRELVFYFFWGKAQLTGYRVSEVHTFIY